ncbi:MAG: hypothetical protein NT084_02700 [Bacteroidetes bacterium]|nr:hypothetical protein [Bacteroidota bacterium]
MKKSILFSIFLFMGLGAFAQKKDSVCVYRQVDDMSDKVYYFPSRKIVCVSDDKQQAFSVSIFINCDSDSNLYMNDFCVKMVGIGSCVENNEIIILFEDGTKIKATSWNDFNCDGDAWIKVSKDDINSLKTKRISKIKLTNGRTFDSYTGVIPPENADYFIQLFYAMEHRKIVTRTDKK